MQPPKVQHLQGLKPNIFRGGLFGKFRRRKKHGQKKPVTNSIGFTIEKAPLDSPLKRSILLEYVYLLVKASAHLMDLKRNTLVEQEKNM